MFYAECIDIPGVIFFKNCMKEEIMNQTNIKIGQLRDRMKELGIDAYPVPTADFHESEYVGEFFKCRHFRPVSTEPLERLLSLWTKPDSDRRKILCTGRRAAFRAVRIKLYRMGELNSRLWTSF